MDILVVTSSTKIDREVAFIRQLFESGLETLHLRKPKWTKREVEGLIREIPVEFHNRIVIHGHYDLAVKYKLKGVHLHRRHRNGKLKNRIRRFLLRMRRPGLKITCTFNSLESIRDNKATFDYVFLNSVFTSHTHYSKTEAAGINMLKSILNKTNNRVYAMGGVNRSRIAIAEAAGFQGVALSSAVWKNLMNDNTAEAISLIQQAA